MRPNSLQTISLPSDKIWIFPVSRSIFTSTSLSLSWITFLAADTSAASTDSIKTLRLIPFSRSIFSNTVNSSVLIQVSFALNFYFTHRSYNGAYRQIQRRAALRELNFHTLVLHGQNPSDLHRRRAGLGFENDPHRFSDGLHKLFFTLDRTVEARTIHFQKIRSLDQRVNQRAQRVIDGRAFIQRDPAGLVCDDRDDTAPLCLSETQVDELGARAFDLFPDLLFFVFYFKGQH